MQYIAKITIFHIFILLCSISVYGQQKSPGAFKIFFEKIYIHTDRNLYIQGEDIWFKAYLINGQTNRIINTSGNLYLELINPDAQIINKQTICLNDGLGNGDFKLADTIPAGSYRIRAYTNWMRNFGDNFIFEKKITVLSSSALTTQKYPVIVNKPKAKKASSDEETIIINTPRVSFYPEGGSLINDVSSLVAVKAEDAKGNGIPLTAEVIASSGRTVAKFICDSLGMGTFNLTPDETQDYTANIIIKGQKHVIELPKALTKGFTLSLSKNDSTIEAEINCNNITLTEFGGNNAVLVGRHGGKVYFKDQIKLSSKSLLIPIPDHNFPEGIATITLYDERSRALSERVIYIDHENKTKLNINTDKTYAPKGKATVKIRLSDASTIAHLSLAVVDAGIIPIPQEDIVTYLLLQSEVRGKIEQPKRYFDTTNVNRAKQLDMLLLTQGWRDFLWKRLADTTLKITNLPENGYTISGRVRQRLSDKPIPRVNVTLSALKAKGTKLFSSRTDSLGKYYFDGLQLFGPQIVKLTSRDDKGKPVGWIIADSLSQSNSPLILKRNLNIDTLAITSNLPEIAKRQTLIKKINLNDTIHLKEINIKTSKNIALLDQVVTSFGYPDENLVVTPKDLNYNTVGDYILHASNQAHTDDSNNIVFWADGKKLYPRLFDNGKEVPFTDYDPPEVKADYYNTYFTIPMDKVIKVVIKKMISSPRLLSAGSLGSNETSVGTGDGSSSAASRLSVLTPIFLVYLTLKPGALDNKDFDIHSQDINGYYNARVFYAPKYEVPNNKTDLRTTIYWEPNITTDKNGEATVSYYNAEPKTNINILVQGITEKGIPVVATTSYIVK